MLCGRREEGRMRSLASRAIRAAWPPILMFLLLAISSEIIIRMLKVPAFLLPAPSAVLRTMWSDSGELLANLATTALASVVGFAAAVVLGILFAILLSTSRFVQRALYPYMVFFQTVPVVAIAPLLVIWIEPGLKSVTICALVVAIFPMIANTLTGLLSADPALRDMFSLYGAGWWASLLKLRLPSAMPNIVTGMRIAAGLAVIGTIVGEFVAGELQGNAGLGVELLVAQKVGRTDLVFAAILVASLLGLGLFGIVNLTGHLLLRRWHASEL